GGVLPCHVAFKLHDTYGFPLYLTQDAVRALDLTVDTAEFDRLMDDQRSKSEGLKGTGQQAAAAEWFAIRDRVGASVFTGYDGVDGTGSVQALLSEGAEVAEAGAGDRVQAVFDRTPFYAESGGQAGDIGLVEWAGGAAKVTDVQKHAGDLHVHALEIVSGALKTGQAVSLHVDLANRTTTRANHSAAHLMHAALRNVLGEHVTQKGQLVDGERLRFDFSHGGPLTADELARIEDEVNAVVLQNRAAETKMMAPQQAIEAGAMALFGEKYGDEVRVLTLGSALAGEGAYSVELCGGTHVARTGDIGLFKIVSEQGIAAGVRRIEGLTGLAARRWLQDQANVARELADRFKVPVSEVAARVDALDAQRRKAEKDLAEAKKALAMGGGGAGPVAAEDLGGVSFIGKVLDGVGGKELRGLAEEFRKQAGVVAIVGTADGKAAVAVAVSPDLTGRFNAAELAKAAVIAMGGQGAGGKPDFAQGGAPDDSQAAAGVAAVRAALG
ncbi:MAG: alanine--tRNA ligase, partial [Caulobacterales bacterium]|nr:alanine--tRNA ligase [Caulobacterales bacterium]